MDLSLFIGLIIGSIILLLLWWEVLGFFWYNIQTFKGLGGRNITKKFKSAEEAREYMNTIMNPQKFKKKPIDDEDVSYQVMYQ